MAILGSREIISAGTSIHIDNDTILKVEYDCPLSHVYKFVRDIYTNVLFIGEENGVLHFKTVDRTKKKPYVLYSLEDNTLDLAGQVSLNNGDTITIGGVQYTVRIEGSTYALLPAYLA